MQMRRSLDEMLLLLLLFVSNRWLKKNMALCSARVQLHVDPSKRSLSLSPIINQELLAVAAKEVELNRISDNCVPGWSIITGVSFPETLLSWDTKKTRTSASFCSLMMRFI